MRLEFSKDKGTYDAKLAVVKLPDHLKIFILKRYGVDVDSPSCYGQLRIT